MKTLLLVLMVLSADGGTNFGWTDFGKHPDDMLLYVGGRTNEPILSIDAKGRLRKGDGFASYDDASVAFWKALEKNNTLAPMLAEKDAEIARLKKLCGGK